MSGRSSTDFGLRLQLLGPVRLERTDAQGVCTPVPLGNRALALLAVLALAGDKGEWRDRLARLLWERSALPQAQDSLRQCLAEIGRRAGPLILREGRLLRLDPALCGVAVKAQAQRGPVRALDLIDLPFLGPRFEAWVLEAREALAARLSGDPDAAAVPTARPELAEGPAPPAGESSPGEPRPEVPTQPVAPTASPRLLLPAIDPALPEAGRRLAEVLREELADTLSRFRDLTVILEGRPLEAIPATAHPPCMAMELRPAGADGQPAMRWRLFEWPSRLLVWSDRLLLDDDAPLAALAALAERAAVAILPEMERHALAATVPLGGEAWQRYLACRERILFLETHDEARQVATDLEALVAAHPDFLAARPPLIRLYNTDYFYTRARSSGPAERARAFDLSRDMVRRDPLFAHGWVVLGWGHLWRADWKAAEDALERAVELNPHHPTRLCEAAYGLLHLDRLDRAEALMLRARALVGHPDPMWWGDWGILRFVAGHALEAHAALGRGLQAYVWTHVFRLAAAVEGGLDPAADAQALAARLATMFGGRAPGRDTLFRWLAASGAPFRSEAVPARLRTALETGAWPA